MKVLFEKKALQKLNLSMVILEPSFKLNMKYVPGGTTYYE